MMTELELTLSEALSFAKVAEMPAELEEGRTDWVKALVLVRKYNGRENYALAINEGGAMPSVVRILALRAVSRAFSASTLMRSFPRSIVRTSAIRTRL